MVDLIPGKEVSLIGEVTSRNVIQPQAGSGPLVKFTLQVYDGDEVTVVRWGSGLAPAIGARVKVRGKVKEFRGHLEVHAYDYVTELTEPPTDPVAQIVGFYIACVEAEAAGAAHFPPGSTGHIEFIAGASPLSGSRSLPHDDTVDQWCHQREMGIGESILAGWPMVIGGKPNRLASPLLTAAVRLTKSDYGWGIEPVGNGVELNPYALDLLGIDRDERDTLMRLVEETPAVEEARSASDRVAAILDVLRDNELEGIADLEPSELAAYAYQAGIHNTGMLFASTGSTQITRMLLEDLNELLHNPRILDGSPAAVMLDQARAPVASLPNPHPTVVPSTLAQDQAVASAMENVLTVVTGPPGTGKSQILVNVVAAAVARKETVLFASNNNQAVDVVFDRLALTSANPCIVRAGPASRRSEVAETISKILATGAETDNTPAAHRQWRVVKKRIRSIHDVLLHRARLEEELVRLDADIRDRLEKELGRLEVDLRGRIEALPEGVHLDVDLAHLNEAMTTTRASLAAFGQGLGLFRRWKKHQQRLDRSRQELLALSELLGFDRNAVKDPLLSVSDKPTRSLAPQREFVAVETTIDSIVASLPSIRKTRSEIEHIQTEIEHTQAEIERKQTEHDALPPKHQLDDQLHDIGPERVVAGRALLDARWEQIRQDDPSARKAAGEVANLLQDAGMVGGSKRAKSLIPSALPTLPVWGVTNLSARTNLPLKPALFDIVVIDEASQCNVASALPLLARARRALIIGDIRQLTHITSLGQARERMIGKQCGLPDEQIEHFSYRKRSCFGLAYSCVDESPIFLDLHFRSHPAIIGFSNEQFYGGRLELCSESKPPQNKLAIEWTRVDGDSQNGPRGKSKVNHQEAQTLAHALVQDAPVMRGLGLSIGVVTPYRAQAELIGEHIRHSLNDEIAREVTVATAHRFQGDERDIIYFSPVVGPSMTEGQAAFASDPNLLNVALTRARRRLVIVGNIEACLSHKNVLADLARYVSRLEAGAFDSPLEQTLYEALLEQGIPSKTGIKVAGNRLDLAVEQNGNRLNIECDGAAFHSNHDIDASRDRVIEAQGWKVLRFSGRRLGSDLAACVEEIATAIAEPSTGTSPR